MRLESNVKVENGAYSFTKLIYAVKQLRIKKVRLERVATSNEAKALELVAEMTREHNIVPIEGGGRAMAAAASSTQSAGMMCVYFFDTSFKSNM